MYSIHIIPWVRIPLFPIVVVKGEIVEIYNQILNSKINLSETFGVIQYVYHDSSKIYSDYFPVLLFLVVALFLTLVLLASFFFAIQKPETEKLSAYECGFEPYEDSRNTFDVKFFLVAILFIIFDIETMYLFPWSVSLSKINILGFWSMVDFIIELSVGLTYVWYIGALEWD